MAAAGENYRLAIRRPKPADLVPLSLALWALAGFVLCLIDAPLQSWVSTAGLLMLSQAFCAGLLKHRYRLVRHAVIPDLLTMFLLFKAINDTVTLLGVLVQHSKFAVSVAILNAGMGANWIDVPDHFQAQAMLVFVAATTIFAGTWILLERHRIVALWHEPPAKKVWIAYIVSCMAYFMLPVNLGQTHSLTVIFAVGAMGVLLGGQSRFAFGKRDSLYVYVAMLPLLADAFRSGMKGNVLLVLIPTLLPLIRKWNIRRVAALGFFLAFVLLVIFPFSQVWRTANWVHTPGMQSQNIGLTEAARRVVNEWETDGVLNTSVTSTAFWLSRGSSAQAGGLVMQIAARDGYLGPVLLKGLGTIFIPRFLWPGKPSYAPGAWFSWYLGLADSPESATTATAMLLPTELYWEFGPLGTLVGMAAITAIMYFVWMQLLKNSRTSVISLVALFAMLIQGIGVEGTFAIYAVSAPLILLVYVMVFRMSYRLLKARPRRITQMGPTRG